MIYTNSFLSADSPSGVSRASSSHEMKREGQEIKQMRVLCMINMHLL